MEQTTATVTENMMQMASTGLSAELEDFDAIVHAEQRRIYRFLLAMLHNPETADDLTQECFLRAFEHRARFRGDCSVRTWLLRIAVNLARDHTKNRRLQFWQRLFQRDAAEEDIPEAVDFRPSPERAVLAREELAGVWSAMETLSPQQRVVFLLRFVEEMTMEEIAETTSLRVGTVKSHLFRAIGAVREYVKGGTR